MGSPFPAPSLPPHTYSISIMMAVQGALRKGTDLFRHVRDGCSTGKIGKYSKLLPNGGHKNTNVQELKLDCQPEWLV